MIDTDRSRITGPIVGIIDPAPVGVGSITASAGSDVPVGDDPPKAIGQLNHASLEQLTQRIETIVTRLEVLMDLMVQPAEAPGPTGDVDSGEGIPPEIGAAMDALIYTDFFRKAVDLGMSPDKVGDAYRLTDLTNVTANLETKEVIGTKEAINALLVSRPYLFFSNLANIGSETNPAKGAFSYPDEIESLARTLGVTPDFAAALVKKRSGKAHGNSEISDVWRIPRLNKLSSLEISG